MKKFTLLFVFALCMSVMNAQTTFDLDWEQGVNGASASFTIAVGDSMHWTWANGVPHSVTSQAGSADTFDSGVLTGMGTEFTFTFTTVGDNSYLCEVHPGNMFGTISVEDVMSVDDKFARNLQFYPNPVNDNMTIASLYRFDTYQIFDMTGKQVGQGVGEGTFTRLDASYLVSGMYFVKIISEAEGLEATLKIIKR